MSIALACAEVKFPKLRVMLRKSAGFQVLLDRCCQGNNGLPLGRQINGSSGLVVVRPIALQKAVVKIKLDV